MANIPLVFLFDVDNTLIDNDGVKADIDTSIKEAAGYSGETEFWRLYEEVRKERDVVDYPATLERFHAVCTDPTLFSRIASLIVNYPFDSRVYPDAMRTIRRLAKIGTPVILSDGDQLYQRLKIARSGLASAVAHHVLVAVHKERQLDELFSAFPADRYVMIDDKPRILSDLKRQFPNRFTTVHVAQGKYAHDPRHTYTPPPDVSVDTIGEVGNLDLAGFQTGRFAVQNS
jgi:FMN phosphatase YigB (HAD superfamily)